MKWLRRAGLMLGIVAGVTVLAVRAVTKGHRQHDQRVAANYGERRVRLRELSDELEQTVGALQGEGDEFEKQRDVASALISQARTFLKSGNVPMGHMCIESAQSIVQQLGSHGAGEAAATEAAEG